MNRIEELQTELERLRARLAELEESESTAAADGQQLRNRWREAIVRADVDGSSAAAREAAKLQKQIQDADLNDERRRIAAAALRSRINSTEAELQRVKDSRPVQFYRRSPEGQQTFGGIRRALKIAPSDWQPVSGDRISYEIARAYPGAAAAIWRSLQNGGTVLLHDGLWEVRAELEHETA